MAIKVENLDTKTLQDLPIGITICRQMESYAAIKSVRSNACQHQRDWGCRFDTEEKPKGSLMLYITKLSVD